MPKSFHLNFWQDFLVLFSCSLHFKMINPQFQIHVTMQEFVWEKFLRPESTSFLILMNCMNKQQDGAASESSSNFNPIFDNWD